MASSVLDCLAVVASEPKQQLNKFIYNKYDDLNDNILHLLYLTIPRGISKLLLCKLVIQRHFSAILTLTEYKHKQDYLHLHCQLKV